MTYHLTRARLLAGMAALALAVASVVATPDATGPDASVPPTPSGWT